MKRKALLIIFSVVFSLISMADEIFTDTSKTHTFANWTSTNAGQNNSTSSCTYTFASVDGTELSFDWKVSSESNYDKLTITLDGTAIVDVVSGEQSSTYTKAYTTAGTHTLVCKYSKDSSVDSGDDKAYVTNFVVVQPEPEKDLRLLFGDMNQNGEISIGDITILSDIAVGKREPMYVLSIPQFIKENKLTGTYTIVGKTIQAKNGRIISGDIVSIIDGTENGGGNTDPDENLVNDHEYVDLGLPSGTLWATCNIGADKPEDYGDYFAWGETETKSSYSSSTSKWYGVSNSNLKSQGVIDANGNLTSSYDVATQKWGGSWRMPTLTEQKELVNNCTWTWSSKSGVNGYTVKGPNGNSIFLPAAGLHSYSSLYDAGSYGYYWSSTAYDDSNYAYCMSFRSDTHGWSYGTRYIGHSVRPVSE